MVIFLNFRLITSNHLYKIMSNQAKNFMGICKGASISSIEQALSLVKPSVVSELTNHFGCTRSNLAFKLQ